MRYIQYLDSTICLDIVTSPTLMERTCYNTFDINTSEARVSIKAYRYVYRLLLLTEHLTVEDHLIDDLLNYFNIHNLPDEVLNKLKERLNFHKNVIGLLA